MPWGWFTQALCVRGRSDGVCKASSGGASPLIPGRTAPLVRGPVELLTPTGSLQAPDRCPVTDASPTMCASASPSATLGESGALESEAVLGQRYGASRSPSAGRWNCCASRGWWRAGRARAGSSPAASFLADAWRSGRSGTRPRRWPTQAGSSHRRVVSLRLRASRRPPCARACDWPTARRPCAAARSARSTPLPLDLVQEWVPAALAGRLSRADAAEPGIWQTLQRAGAPGRLGPPDGSPPVWPPTRTPALLERGCRHPAAPGASARAAPATAAPSPCPTTATWPTGSASRSSSTAGPPGDEPPAAHRRAPTSSRPAAPRRPPRVPSKEIHP